MEILHVTSITRFAKCPYHYKYSERTYIPPEKTYPGDILNVAVTSNPDSDMKPFIDQFARHMDGDFKFVQTMESVCKEARSYTLQVKRLYKQVYQEAKLMYKYNDDIWIVGSPDIFYYDSIDDIRCCRDFKFGQHKFYESEETRLYDAQMRLYPLMICEYMNTDEVSFGFKVWDKGTGELRDFGHKVTKKEAKEWLDKIMIQYQECVEFDERPAKGTKTCFFERLPGCPGGGGKVSDINMESSVK